MNIPPKQDPIKRLILDKLQNNQKVNLDAPEEFELLTYCLNKIHDIQCNNDYSRQNALIGISGLRKLLRKQDLSQFIIKNIDTIKLYILTAKNLFFIINQMIDSNDIDQFLAKFTYKELCLCVNDGDYIINNLPLEEDKYNVLLQNLKFLSAINESTHQSVKNKALELANKNYQNEYQAAHLKRQIAQLKQLRQAIEKYHLILGISQAVLDVNKSAIAKLPIDTLNRMMNFASHSLGGSKTEISDILGSIYKVSGEIESLYVKVESNAKKVATTLSNLTGASSTFTGKVDEISADTLSSLLKDFQKVEKLFQDANKKLNEFISIYGDTAALEIKNAQQKALKALSQARNSSRIKDQIIPIQGHNKHALIKQEFEKKHGKEKRPPTNQFK